MESGFVANQEPDISRHWDRINHAGSGRFEFFRVRLYGAMHFVKRPAPRFAHDLQTLESLRKEFNIGYNLSHPALPKYVKMEDGAIYEEYIDGLSIRQMIERNDDRLKSPEFLEDFCRQLLEVTQYIHSHGIVHNDIKPDNVMISRIGDRVKLVDFGCALTDAWDSTPGFTPDFKAPEQGTAMKTNIQADIYLVGKLMELLAPMAHTSRRWRNFIHKATAPEVAARFGSDSEAIATIPYHTRLSRRIIAVATVAAIIATVIIFLRPAHEAAAIEVAASHQLETPAPTPEKYSEIPTPTGPAQAAPHDAPKKISSQDSIDKALSKYISEKYNTTVFPECKKYEMMTDPDEMSRQDTYIRQTIMPSAISDVMEYAQTLVSTHPDQAEYIQMKAMEILNAKQTTAALMLENAFKKINNMEDLTPDSITRIFQ